MRRFAVVAFAVVALAAVSISTAAAGGVSAAPATIEIDDALRGSTVFRETILYNNTGVETPFSISFEGPAGGWMSAVDSDDRETPITEVLDADGSGTSVIVRIDIPSDVPLGRYEAVMTAALAPPSGNKGIGVGVGLGVKLLFGFEVGGNEVIAADVLDVGMRDTEVGVPAHMDVVLANRGNTQIVPQFTLEILKAGSVVSSSTTGSIPLFPSEEKMFEVRWDTSEADTGEYTARLAIDFGGVDLGIHERTFNVHAAGTLNRELVLTSLVVDGAPRAGGLTGLRATVHNPGRVDTAGSVMGDLVLDGQVISTFESQQFLVAATETLDLPIKVETPEAGRYEFTAIVVFGDGESEPLSVLIEVGASDVDTAQPTPAGFPTGPAIAGLAAILVLGAAGAWLALNRRRSRALPANDTSVTDDLASVGDRGAAHRE